MCNGWSAERRARQAELTRGWRPWEWSTGPHRVEGKARSSLYAYKGAKRDKTRAVMCAPSELLREHADALRLRRESAS